MDRRLICVLEHPTQYDPPLWRRMTQRGRVKPIVWYLQGGVPRDEELQRSVSWGHRSDEGFQAEFITANEIRKRLKLLDPVPSAILTSGWTSKSTWLALWAAKRLRIPVILPSDKITMASRGWKVIRRPFQLLHILKNRFVFDGFFTTGSLGEKALESTGVVRERIARGLYPVDVEWWQARLASLKERTHSLREQAGEEAFVVLAVSKWAEREDPLLMVRAFARFQKEASNGFFIFVGDGPLRPALEAEIQSLGIQKSVILPGYVPYEQLAAYYGAADVFLHAPIHGPWEISLAEAMACGVPVVATTNVGAAHDLVVDRKTGVLTAARNAEALAQSLAVVARERENQNDMKSAVLDQVRAIDVDAVSSGIESLIERLSEAGPCHVK